MRSTLCPGLTAERAYRVGDDRTVSSLLPESPAFGVLPRVLATGYLVGLIEWTCMDAVAAHLDADERSLGVHVDLSHEAPTPPGDTLTIRAELTAVDRRRLTFDVLAKNDQAIVCRGTHERAVIDLRRFQERLQRSQTGEDLAAGSPVNLEEAPAVAAALCRAAHRRLSATVVALSDVQVRAPSRLKGWSVGHVLTHLARNADAHARRLSHALRSEDVAKYAGGDAQRASEIEAGAGRTATELVGDLDASQARLEVVFEESDRAGWPDPRRLGHGYGPRGCPAHRLREVEMHHVDLGLGYEPADWPDEYVAWDLPVLLGTLDERLTARGPRRDLLAWLAGRRGLPTEMSIPPWG